MIYLDNAATTFPKPQQVIKAVSEAQMNATNPARAGHTLSACAGKIVYYAREKASILFSSKIENVVFTKNCTESLNIAIKGVIETGDHVIISSLEHNSVLRPIEYLSQKRQITYDVAYVEPQDEEKTIQNFRALINSKTKAIICTHVSNVFGTVLPIKKIGQLCKEKNIIFIVDAAQSAGVLEISVEKDNIDILCLPGHKGLLGPMGTGMMILNTQKNVDSLMQGGTGSYSLESAQPEIMPDKFESGTLNLSGIAGMSAGIDFLLARKTRMDILSHENALINTLKEDLSSIKNVRIYDDMHGKNHAPVLSFTIGDMHSEAVADVLDKNNIAVRAGYHCAYLSHKTYKTDKIGTVRVSPGIFNTKKDIKNLCFCLNKIAMTNNLC